MKRKQLKAFLQNPESEDLKFELGCPNTMMELVEALGGHLDDEPMDTNGWQWDYWKYGTYLGKRFCISGSGFYGDTMIAWDDEE